MKPLVEKWCSYVESIESWQHQFCASAWQQLCENDGLEVRCAVPAVASDLEGDPAICRFERRVRERNYSAVRCVQQ
jgi:hypothetical protein